MPDRDDETSASKDFVQSLGRGLSVIEAFDEAHRDLTLSEVARRTGLTRAAARRFLLTLVELGYMRNDDGRFSLRPRVLGLGHAYLSSLSLPDVALPHMRELSTATHESASLAVLDEDEVVYVAQMTAVRPMAVRIEVGTRLPAFATAMGRVLLAAQPDRWIEQYLARAEFVAFTARTVTSPRALEEILRDVRRDGYAYVDQELDSSLRALAVPVNDSERRTIAALNISNHGRSAEDAIRDVLPAMKATVSAIERDLSATEVPRRSIQIGGIPRGETPQP
jgi:IclR family pca regulon transcriptional regulator